MFVCFFIWILDESREIIQKIKENMALEDQEYNDLEDEGDRE